jgi:hypothetical protein
METSSIQDNLYKKYKKSLLTKKEAAQEMSCSCSSLDRMRQLGIIRSKKLMGCVYFSITEIARVIES